MSDDTDQVVCHKCGGSLGDADSPAKCSQCGRVWRVLSCPRCSGGTWVVVGLFEFTCATCGANLTTPAGQEYQKTHKEFTYHRNKLIKYGVILLIAVVGTAALMIFGSNQTNTPGYQMTAACADVESMAQDNANGTLADSQIPALVQSFHNDASIGTPKLQAAANQMLQAVTAVENGSSPGPISSDPAFMTGTVQALDVCHAAGD